jgi:hypothetical protein
VIIILISSVNKIGLNRLDVGLGRSLIYVRNNKGPSMEPRGTPYLMGPQSGVYFLES